MSAHWSSPLSHHRDLARWAAGQPTPAAAWQACPHGSWLLWALTEFGADRPALILAACACARTVLPIIDSDSDVALATEAIETAEAWARGEVTGRECRRVGDAAEVKGPLLRPAATVAGAAAIAAFYWDTRNGPMSDRVASVASLAASALATDGVPYDVHSQELADLVRGRRFPLRTPSATEVRRSDALAVAWDRLGGEVDESATLSAVQVLCSWWTALSLGLDASRSIDSDSLVLRAVAERLQLAPRHLPLIQEAISAARTIEGWQR